MYIASYVISRVVLVNRHSYGYQQCGKYGNVEAAAYIELECWLLAVKVCKQRGRDGEREGERERERERERESEKTHERTNFLSRCTDSELKIYVCVLSKLALSCLV